MLNVDYLVCLKKLKKNPDLLNNPAWEEAVSRKTSLAYFGPP